jgi:tellurite resistance protein TerC
MKVGVALVLVFVGLKMLLAEVYQVPIWASLAVIALLLGGSMALGWRRGGGARAAPGASPAPRRPPGRPSAASPPSAPARPRSSSTRGIGRHARQTSGRRLHWSHPHPRRRRAERRSAAR